MKRIKLAFVWFIGVTIIAGAILSSQNHSIELDSQGVLLPAVAFGLLGSLIGWLSYKKERKPS
jgi:predicted tellurium resistance membrane protein TerC